jgi:uridine kinase
MITVTLSDGKILKYPKNTKILEIAKKEQIKYKNLIVSSTYNGELIDLQYELTEDGKLNFIELNTEEGMRVYVRSLLFLFIVAVSKKRPEVKIEVKNSIGDGLF